MKEMEFSRPSFHWIGIVAVASGIMAAGLIGVGELYDATQDSDQGPNVEAYGVVRTSPAVASRFLEWNTSLPPFDIGPVKSGANMRFMELNLNLPSQSLAAVDTHVAKRFLEWNTGLPESASLKADLSMTTRFIEVNMLPGDETPQAQTRTTSQTNRLTE